LRIDVYLDREGNVTKILMEGKEVKSLLVTLGEWIRDDVYIHTPSGYLEKIRCYATPMVYSPDEKAEWKPDMSQILTIEESLEKEKNGRNRKV